MKKIAILLVMALYLLLVVVSGLLAEEWNIITLPNGLSVLVCSDDNILSIGQDEWTGQVYAFCLPPDPPLEWGEHLLPLILNND